MPQGSFHTGGSGVHSVHSNTRNVKSATGEHSPRAGGRRQSSVRHPVPAASPDGPVIIPSEEQLMKATRLHTLADQLTQSSATLRAKLQQLETRMKNTGTKALLPFQIRRAEQEKEQLEIEIHQTAHTIQRLQLMSVQMDGIIGLKDEVFDEVKSTLETDIEKLQAEHEENIEPIRHGYIQRISMLQRYWPWRQLKELGDTTVGATFEKELARGPRFRNVGVQNNIETDYIRQQLLWLEEFSKREEVFRRHLRQLDVMVEDMNDINELLETTLTCPVCDLLFEEPVLMWPCGHTFCVVCFGSLLIAPSLYRCPICGSLGSEGFVHNLLLAETVAKWMFKDSGYGDLQVPLNAIRVHLAQFQRDEIIGRIEQLRAEMKAYEEGKTQKKDDKEIISVSFRLY